MTEIAKAEIFVLQISTVTTVKKGEPKITFPVLIDVYLPEDCYQPAKGPTKLQSALIFF